MKPEAALLQTDRRSSFSAQGSLTLVSGLRLHAPYLLVVVVVAVLAGWPLFQFRLMSGHDSLTHIRRAVEFYQELEEGELLPRWAPHFGAGYGEPVFIFYPLTVYYVTSGFHWLGAGIIASQDLACFALLVVAGLGMYVLASELFGPRGGLASAVSYLLAPYVLVTLYVRHALFDFSSFAFMPFAFWGLYRFLESGRASHFFVATISVVLLLLSSNTVALLTFPALGLLVVVFGFVKRSVRTLAHGALCLALALGMSAFFWLPALAELKFVNSDPLVEGYNDFRDHFVSLHQFVYSPWRYGDSQRGDDDGMSFEVGAVQLALLPIAVLFTRGAGRFRRHARDLTRFFLVLLFLAVLLATDLSLILWERFPFLEFLQFPWRALSLVAVSAAFLSGSAAAFLLAYTRWPAMLLLAPLIGAFLLLGAPHARPGSFLDVTDADFTPQSIAEKGVSVAGVRPIWVTRSRRPPAADRLTFLVKEKGRILERRESSTRYSYSVEVDDDAKLRLNTTYFPGWTILVDGEEIPIDYYNPDGLMDFSLESGEHFVEVYFGDTPIRQVSKAGSAGALLLFVLLVGHRRRHEKPLKTVSSQW